jgi:predicted phage tail protein
MTGQAIRSELLREVRLYGHLGAKFGRVHVVAVRTCREAAQALATIIPGFAQELLDHQPGHNIFAGQRDRIGSIAEDRLDAPVGRGEPISIVPVIAGAKRGGLFQIILGAAILIFAPYAAGALFGLGTSFGTSAALAIAQYGTQVGLSMILGGVAAALTPTGRNSSAPAAQNNPSYNLGTPINQTAQGVAIPVRYGRGIWGSVVVSQGISASEFESAAPITPTTPAEWPYTWMPQHVYTGAV